MKSKRILFGALFASLIFVFFALTIVFIVPIEYLVPGHRGDIVHAQQCTRLILLRYEITRNPSKLGEWLPMLDGAPLQEAGVIFTDWGIDHPGSFIAIIDGLETKERESVIAMVSYVVIDRRMNEDFDQAFDRYNAPAISEIRTEIQKESK